VTPDRDERGRFLPEDMAHGYARYHRGCRCPVCREGARLYVAGYRARKRGLTPVPAARDVARTPGDVEPDRATSRDQITSHLPADQHRTVLTPGPCELTPGPCERAVLADVETLPAAASNQALVQAACAMARILDNRLLATTQPSAARQLSSLMLTLRKASAPARGRLAAISKMATRPDAG